MRSADRVLRAAALLALGMTVSGCALRSSAPGAAVSGQVWRAAQPAEQATALVAASATAAAPGLPARDSLVPAEALPAAARQAFEQAVRTLAAGRLDEAERAFLALAEAHPQMAGAQANLGLIDRRCGRLEQAAVRLQRAAGASPAQPLYLNELGIVYRELGRFAEARQAYERAIELAPAYAAPQLNLGILLDLYLGDSAAALAAYERYLALEAADEKVHKWVAELRNRKPAAQLAGTRPQR
jgi:tetratricopeptide (TPR) repeat protein